MDETDAAGTSVSEIMSRQIVAIRSDCELRLALDAFVRTALRHLVVVDPDRTCHGLLSAEQALLALGSTPSGPGQAPRLVADTLTRTPVAERPRVHRDASVRDAASVMLDALVDALPVVDDSGRVVGVVTWSDIVALVAGRHLLGTDRP
ncbi:HPP family protein [Nocardioides sp. LS1]|uniref:CBS domain-containing protein n=1 Tax=Nocardioides sp. LS1 TaxID=1027620 RepID=UPI000F6180F5|nr:CBS domain-containing protein [Nocardioides sp. LS1]GCD91293.1 hypothetical protein NLS1_32990 [Nocardioides sp. LS1]